MTQNDGGPAFPFPSHAADGSCGQGAHPGMSLREWLAGAIQVPMFFEEDRSFAEALLGLAEPNWTADPEAFLRWVTMFRARWRCAEADALLAELAKTEPEQ